MAKNNRPINEYWMAGTVMPGTDTINWAPWTAASSLEECRAIVVAKDPRLVNAIVTGELVFNVVYISQLALPEMMGIHRPLIVESDNDAPPARVPFDSPIPTSPLPEPPDNGDGDDEDNS